VPGSRKGLSSSRARSSAPRRISAAARGSRRAQWWATASPSAAIGFVGPCASITHALIGNRVIVHAGARIGQDGFGFAMGPGGHYKVRQIGRVIIQDNVEIGANTSIDRGALKDTLIGEGAKIDNLVQIAHNVVIGRHCVIAAQTGISGSTVLEDYVAMGGQCGTVGHIRIGMGAQIAARAEFTAIFHAARCGAAIRPSQSCPGNVRRPCLSGSRDAKVRVRTKMKQPNKLAMWD